MKDFLEVFYKYQKIRYDFILRLSGFAVMSEENSEKPKNKIVFVTLKMPDGKEHEIPLPPKVFSSGREGFYAQIPALVYENEVYGGQIQVWKKTPKFK